MPIGLIGTKVGMTQVYDDKGLVQSVTVLQLGPCPVLQVRTEKIDGYDAVQLGFQEKSRKKASRAERGHVAKDLQSKRKALRQASGVAIPAKAGVEPPRVVREFRTDGPVADAEPGKVYNVQSVFAEVKNVDVIGTSKGRGYTGVMKRHNFDGMPAAHGAKKVHRQAGSTGGLASNRGTGRPKKGLKRAGQHGNARITTRNLMVVSIDLENNLLLVKGAVPGFNGATVLVRPTNFKRKMGQKKS